MPQPSIRQASLAIGVLLMVLGFLGWTFGGAIDRWLHVALHAHGDPALLRWLLRLTNLGGAAALIPLGLVVCGLLALRRRFAAAVWLFATVGVGRLLVELAKIGFHRPRPPSADRLADVTSLSFPSSHASGAVLTFAAICVVFDSGPAGWIASGVFAVAIGLSRVVLGVHWPSDVVAGWGFGLAWIMLCARWLPPGKPANAA